MKAGSNCGLDSIWNCSQSMAINSWLWLIVTKGELRTIMDSDCGLFFLFSCYFWAVWNQYISRHCFVFPCEHTGHIRSNMNQASLRHLKYLFFITANLHVAAFVAVDEFWWANNWDKLPCIFIIFFCWFSHCSCCYCAVDTLKEKIKKYFIIFN